MALTFVTKFISFGAYWSHMGCLFSPVLLTGQGLFQMYSFLGNKGPFSMSFFMTLKRKIEKNSTRRRFPPAFPQNTNKEFRAWLTEAVCVPPLFWKGAKRYYDKNKQSPKGSKTPPSKPTLFCLPLSFQVFCDLEEEAWAIFPLQLMRPPASAVLNYSPPFESLSVPTNLVDWNQIGCFDWQGSDLLTEKLGGVWGVERRQFTSETLA